MKSWSTSTRWLACYDMCLISFSWDSVIYCTLTSLGFGESIRVLVKWLTECDWMAKSQLSQTNSLISNCLLRYSNFSFIKAIDWHCYCNHSLIIKYTERKPFWFGLAPFHEYLLIILWWDWFLVPRSMCKINMVSKHTAGQRSISQKQAFWQISPWNLRNMLKNPALHQKPRITT